MTKSSGFSHVWAERHVTQQSSCNSFLQHQVFRRTVSHRSNNANSPKRLVILHPLNSALNTYPYLSMRSKHQKEGLTKQPITKEIGDSHSQKRMVQPCKQSPIGIPITYRSYRTTSFRATSDGKKSYWMVSCGMTFSRKSDLVLTPKNTLIPESPSTGVPSVFAGVNLWSLTKLSRAAMCVLHNFEIEGFAFLENNEGTLPNSE